MAASVPGEFPSCITSVRNRRPHSDAVRNLFAVDWSRYSGLGKMVVLREGNNGFTCMPGNPKAVGEPPMCVDAAAMQWIVKIIQFSRSNL